MVIISEKTEVSSKPIIRTADVDKPNDKSMKVQEIINRMKQKSILVVLLRVVNNI